MKTKRLSMILILALLVSLIGVTPAQAEQIPDVTGYSYTITPVLSPFPYYLYVKTDNPDPTSFRLVDKSSVLYGPEDYGEIRLGGGFVFYSAEVDPGTYYISQDIYPDVVYEDESVWRVPGGYIFQAYNAFSDGGEFVLLQKTSTGSNILNDVFVETDVTIPCQTLTDRTGYLIDTCTTDEMSFFEKLNAVQARLRAIAVYPRDVFDSSSPSEERPYPLLAASPYEELWLNEHYDSMYELLPGGMLAANAYPFVLDSLGFPGTVEMVARQLEPSCVVESGAYHYLIDVTFNGETYSYGGAGTGGRDPLYSQRVEKVFTFRGGDDLAANGTVQRYFKLLTDYDTVAQEDAAASRDLIRGDTFNQTIGETGGTWIRIATEGLGYGTSFAYVVPSGYNSRILSDAWVDGRYVNTHETVHLYETFEDHPNANIVLPDLTFIDYNGQTRTQDMILYYNASQDNWHGEKLGGEGSYYYNGAWIGDELILTREEVEALVPDRNNSHWPESGLVYDGTEYPGTPFVHKRTTGVQVPQTLELYEGGESTIPATVEPEDAGDNRVNWTSSDSSVVEVLDSESGWIRAVGAGTAVLTAVTVDGGYSASCTVTVRAKPNVVFWDVSGKHWFYNTVLWAVENGITTGTTPITFEPDATCTRNQVVTFLWRAAGSPEPASSANPFVDVKKEDYFYKAVLWAVENGITTGVDAAHFDPEGACTRAQVVTFLHRAEGKSAPASESNPFTDVPKNGNTQWYYTAVLWAVENEITTGVTATTFEPESTCTRAQIVTFLNRAYS